MKYENNSDLLLGKRFGKLEVISKIYIKKNRNNKDDFSVDLKCDCGTITNSTIKRILYGKKDHCGCKNNPRFKYFSFNGETKNLKDWSKDPRCVVAYSVLLHRVSYSNWDLEKALFKKAKNHPEYLIGEKFKRLTVVGVKKDKYNNKIWECLCVCGKGTYRSSYALTSGKATSCGCFISELCHKRAIKRKVGKGNAAKKAVLHGYKRNAKERNLKIEISEENFFKMTKENCHYCGCEPNQRRKSPNMDGEYIYNGIDRVDSNLGYFESNCVPCCKDCNYAKRDMTRPQFLNKIKQIFYHLKLNE